MSEFMKNFVISMSILGFGLFFFIGLFYLVSLSPALVLTTVIFSWFVATFLKLFN